MICYKAPILTQVILAEAYIYTHSENTACNHPYSQPRSAKKFSDAPCYFSSLGHTSPQRALPRLWVLQRWSYSYGNDSGFLYFPVAPKQEGHLNMLAALKKLLHKTHLSSEIRRRVYLKLLLQSNIQTNKTVTLECCLHQHQQKPKKRYIHSNFTTKGKALGPVI